MLDFCYDKRIIEDGISGEQRNGEQVNIELFRPAKEAEVKKYVEKRLLRLGCEEEQLYEYEELIRYLLRVRVIVKDELFAAGICDVIEKIGKDLKKVTSKLLGEEAEEQIEKMVCILDSLYFIRADLCSCNPHNEDEEEELNCAHGKIYKLLSEYELCDDYTASEEVVNELMRAINKKKIAHWSPRQIRAYMDYHVIGQENAKKALSRALFVHYLRIRNPEKALLRNVVLLAGPTGCGKTELMRCMEKLADVPVCRRDISDLSTAQSAGKHIDDVFEELYLKAGKDKEKAEHGIVFLDEFDKILIPSYSRGGENCHDTLQSQLLAVIEGGRIEVKSHSVGTLILDTTNMLFILGGAFDGVEDYIKKEEERKNNIGNFGFTGSLSKTKTVEMTQENLTVEVLQKFGMKRELAGRIGEIAVLERLSKESLLRILTEPKDNLISRYEREVKLMCGAKLEISKEVLEEIANKAAEDKIGARALFPLVREAVRPALFQAACGQKRKVICVE